MSLKKAMFGFSLLVFLFSIAYGQENYSNWNSSATVLFNTSNTGANTATNQVNFPVLIRLTTANAPAFFAYEQARGGNGADLRFSKTDGTHLPYEMKYDAARQKVTAWVKVDTVFGNSTTQAIKFYWGNAASVDSTKSSAVFPTANGFKAVMHLNARSGNNFYDATGVNTPVGEAGIADTDGVFDRAAYFRCSGTASTYMTGDSITITGLLGNPTTMTLSSWVRVDSIDQFNTGKIATIVSLGDYASLNVSGASATAGNDSMIGSWFGKGSQWNNFGYPNAAAPSGHVLWRTGWKHVAMVLNSTGRGGYAKLYINGDSARNCPADSILTWTGGNNGKRTVIGKHGGGQAGKKMGGSLCEVRIENALRSSDWMRLSYKNQAATDLLTTVPAAAAAPTLVAPASGALGQNINLSLNWSSNSLATGYRVQVSTSSVFAGNTIYDQSGLTATGWQVPAPLGYNTQYWWRVNIADVYGDSSWTIPGSFQTAAVLGAPPQLSPANSVINQPTALTLAWNGVSGATGYEVQVSTDASFNSTVLDQTGSSLSLPLSGLSNITPYYWKVAAVSGTDLYWSNAWTFTTIISTPTLAAPSNGAINQALTGTSLSWNPVTSAETYTVLLSTSSTFANTVFSQSGSATSAVVSATLGTSKTYYWEVNATGSGSTGAWSAVWSFGTVPPPPSVPALVSPGSNLAPIQPLSPVLSWNSSTGTGPVTYEVQVSQNSSFSSTLYDFTGLSTTSQSIGPLSLLTPYYWEVRATNVGGTSNWSGVSTFQTIEDYSQWSNHLKISINTSASGGGASIASNQAKFPLLVRLTNTNAAGFGVNAGKDLRFSRGADYSKALPYQIDYLSPTNDTASIWVTVDTVFGGNAGQYIVLHYGNGSAVDQQSAIAVFDTANGFRGTWHLGEAGNTAAGGYKDATVRGVNGTGVAMAAGTDTIGIIGKAQKFNGTSQYITMGANRTGISGNVSRTLECWVKANQAVNYNCFIGLMPNNATNSTYCNFQENGGKYAWDFYGSTYTSSVSTTDQTWHHLVGTYSASQSPTAQFYIDGVLAASGAAPAQATVDSFIIGYRQSNPSYFQGVIDEARLSSVARSADWNILSYQTQRPDQIMVGVGAPAAPVLATPSNGSTNLVVAPSFSWTATNGAASYEIQISAASDFSTIAVDQPNIAGLTYQASGLLYDMTYYWRVAATNATGNGAWSNVSIFSTKSGTPTVPALISPVIGSVNQQLAVALSWNSSTGTAPISYELQVSQSSDFSSTLYDFTGVSATSQTVSSLPFATTLYWQVRGANPATTGNWSSVWSFSTVEDFNQWSSHIKVAINTSGNGTGSAAVSSNQANFPLLVRLTNTNAPNFGANGGKDLRFSKSTDITKMLPYQIDYLSPTNDTAAIWVNVDTVFGNNSSQYIMLHFGNASVASLQSAPAVFDSSKGFCAVYHLGEANPTSLSDATGHGYTGVGSASLGDTIGVIGHAKKFKNSQPDSVRIASIMGSPSIVTMSCWAKVDSLDGNQNGGLLITMGDHNGLRVDGAAAGGRDSLMCYGYNGNWTNAQQTNSPGSNYIYHAGWKYLACVMNPQAGIEQVYINGVPATMGGQSTYTFNWSGQGQVTMLGHHANNNAGWKFGGIMDEPRIEKVARSTDWLNLSYQTQRPDQVIVGVGAPVAPVIALPTNGATSQPTSGITLSWTPAAGATTYEVQLSSTSDFTTVLMDQANLQGLSQAVLPTLDPAESYYWRVNATNLSGTGAWSNVTKFTTLNPWGAPVLLTPANAGGNVPITAVLSWSSAFNTPSYSVQVSTESAFGSTVYLQSGISGLTTTVPGLANATTYYWQANALNIDGVTNSSWSDVWSFTTVIAPPDAPTLAMPSTSLSGVSLTPTLSWNTVNTALSYGIQISTDATWATTVYQQTGITSGTTLVSPTLNYLTTYYWRANASNINPIAGAWSMPDTFQTIISPPGAPNLASPASGTTELVQTAPLGLSWSSGTGTPVTSYEVMVSTSSTFASTVFDTVGVTTASAVVPGIFSLGTTYYWQVRASNVNPLPGAWSKAFSFATTSEDYTTWPSSRSITLNTSTTGANVATNQVNFPVLVKLTSANAAAVFTAEASNANPGADIRFAKADGTHLVFELNKFDQANKVAVFWVKLDTVFGNNATQSINMYWGNNSVISSTSDSSKVFSPANGFAGVYHLNKRSGTGPYTYTDATGQGRNATADNAITDTTGVFDRAASLHCTGTGSSYLDGDSITIAGLFGSPATVTMSAWVRIDSLDQYSATSNWYGTKGRGVIMGLGDNAGLSAAGIAGSATDSLWGAGHYSSASWYSFTWPSPSLTGNSVRGLPNSAGHAVWHQGWRYISMVLNPNGDNGYEKLYLNGDSVRYTLVGNNPITYTAGTRTVIGKHGSGTVGQKFGGSICEARFENMARSSDWIQLSFQNQQANDRLLTIYMAAPILSLPANSTQNQPISSAALSWNAVSGASGYRVQVSTDAAFGSTVLDQGKASTSTSVSAMTAATTYYWHVNASDAGGTSNWSATWSFTTAPPAAAPVLSSPAAGAVNQPLSVSLAWNTVSGAISYNARVSTSSGFGSAISSQTGLATTGATVSGLINGMTYYWQANAVGDGGTGSWSAAWSFTTVLVPPTLSAPANNGAVQAANLSLSWMAEPGVTSYAVRVSTASDFASTVASLSSASTSVAASGVTGGATYYWQANATGAGGSTAWSGTWSFKTILNPPALFRPMNNATGQLLSLDLNWLPVTGTTSYELQVSNTSDFKSTVYDQTGLTAAAATVSGLSYNNAYYWRVNATNSIGTSTWSAAWQFNTVSLQVIALNASWNMKSLNLRPVNDTTSVVFGSHSGFFYAKDIAGNPYSPTLGEDRINHVLVGQGYQIYSSVPDSLRIQGVPVDYANNPIALNAGWNMIGYLPQAVDSVQHALAGISSSIVIVKNNGGDAYAPTWDINDLNVMVPGEGYKVLMSSSASLTYPGPVGLTKADSGKVFKPMLHLPSPKHFAMHAITGNNATLGATEVMFGDKAAPDNSEVAAFDAKGNLIGAATVVKGVTCITVWGDDPLSKEKDGCAPGEKITFKLWNGSQEYPLVMADKQVSYAEDAVIGGRFFVPEGAFITKFDLSKVYPNPFRGAVKIAFDVPTINGIADHQIEIQAFDMKGSMVQQIAKGKYHAGRYVLAWNAAREGGAGSGVFVIRMKAQNFDKRIKLIRVN